MQYNLFNPFLFPSHTVTLKNIYALKWKLIPSQKDHYCWLLFSYLLDDHRNRIEFNGICEKCCPCHCDNAECGTETATQSFKVLPIITKSWFPIKELSCNFKQIYYKHSFQENVFKTSRFSSIQCINFTQMNTWVST